MTDRRMAREGCSSAGTHHGRETNWWIAFLQKHSWWWLKLPRPWILTQVTSSGTAKAWQLLTDNHFQMALIPPIQTLVHSPPLSCFKKFWLLFPPTLACPSVTDSDPSYFSPFWVCVCGMQERGYEYSNVWVHVPACTPAQMCTCTESPVSCFGLPLNSLNRGLSDEPRTLQYS